MHFPDCTPRLVGQANNARRARSGSRTLDAHALMRSCAHALEAWRKADPDRSSPENAAVLATNWEDDFRVPAVCEATDASLEVLRRENKMLSVCP